MHNTQHHAAQAGQATPAATIRTLHSPSTRSAATSTAQWPAIELEHRPAVPTEQAAYYLSRRPQTLRGWACNEDGPLRPLRINGRLAWPMAAIRQLLGVAP